MLPTPSTSHVTYDRVYEPAEDSFLLLDTLSSESEKAFLASQFSQFNTAERTRTSPPLVAEIGTGSGVVLGFINAHANIIFGRPDVYTLGIDINGYACRATAETVQIAAKGQIQNGLQPGHYLGNVASDLTTSMKSGSLDVLVFNPPYVPTPALPEQPADSSSFFQGEVSEKPSFDDDSYLLALSYAGGVDGMEITNRLLEDLPRILSPDRGVAYILLCAQNKPEIVKQEIRDWGSGWAVETVGSSGKQAGWEKLQIIRIWRQTPNLSHSA